MMPLMPSSQEIAQEASTVFGVDKVIVLTPERFDETRWFIRGFILTDDERVITFSRLDGQEWSAINGTGTYRFFSAHLSVVLRDAIEGAEI